MATGKRKAGRKHTRGGGKVLPVLLNVFGVLLIVAVIVFCAPMTVPRLFGYEPFEVVTGSMEPEIPVGSAVYAKAGNLTEIGEGDIIAYYEGGSAVVHRVVTNRTSLGEFVTKGDANNAEDPQPVPYDNVVGRVEAHYDGLGVVLRIFSSTMGKVYLALTVACGIMLIVLSGSVRRSRETRAREIQAALAQMQGEEAAGGSAGAGVGANEGVVAGAEGVVGGVAPSTAAGAASGAIPSPTRPKRAANVVRKVLIVVLLALFVGSAGVVGFTWWQHASSDAAYDQASDLFTKKGTQAPIDIDFDALRAVNPDVVGWIYCEDTVINYPVLQGRDNDQYLLHDYTHAYNIDGSIFVDADNRPGFVDSNTIIYGHNMDFGAMFHCLQDWHDQAFYEAHPVIWLLTPEKNYRIVLFSGHHVAATSSMYDIISEPGEQLAAFLSSALEQSDFDASTKLGDIKLTQNAQYVMLSTCAYLFDGDRYVLHGQLVPAE